MFKKKILAAVITFSFIGSLLGGINLITETVLAEEGGPDDYGYIWRDSNDPDPKVAYDWIDASGGTTLQWIGGTNPPGDDMYNYTTLPFPFEFYGVEYTSIYVNLNGAIDFGDPNTLHDQWTNKNIPDPAAPNNYIAAFWDDLQIFDTVNQKVTVMQGGSAPERYFVIEWYHVSFFAADTTEITFEMILYEKDSVIKFQYQQAESGSDSGNNGAEATVGIESQNGSVGLLYSYNQPVIQNGMAIVMRLPDYPYDLEVDDLWAPEFVVTGNQFYVNATIVNKGDFYEDMIEVNFSVNGVLEDQIPLDLNPDESQNVTFYFTPNSDGDYAISVEVSPLPLETFLVNNLKDAKVIVFRPSHYLLVDRHHGNDLSNLESFFEELFKQGYWLNYTQDPVINQADLFGYDALIVLRPSIPYSDLFEVGPISDWVSQDGGDLFLLAGGNQAPLNSLTATWSNISWNGPAPANYDTVTNNIAFHPVGAKIDELYYTASSFTLNRQNAHEIVTDDVGATLIGAADRVAFGKLFAVAGAGDFDNANIDLYNNKQYLENIFEWLLRPVEPDDVGLWNFYAPDVAMPSTSFFVNATVSNYGSSNQVNVDVYLFINGGFQDLVSLGTLNTGASKNVSFSYSHPIDEPITVELQALPQPGPDDYPEDNTIEKITLITSLSVVGWTYSDSSDFTYGLEDIMNRMNINYEPGASGWGESGPFGPFWNYQFIILDGNGEVRDKKNILSAAFNDTVVVVNYNTFEDFLSELNQPQVFTNNSFGFSSRYIFIGGGLIVESDFSNDDNLASEWRGYSTAKKEDLALHLSSFVNILIRTNDITLSRFTAKKYLITGFQIYANATIYNAGTSTHNNILVNFTVNSILEGNYTIVTLSPGSFEVVSFLWTPLADGIYNIKISAEIQPGETYYTNNYQSISSKAYTPFNFILVDSGHKSKSTSYGFFVEDMRNRGIWINHSESLNSNILSMHEAFVSFNPRSEYTIGELTALQTFINNGGGMLVCGGSNQTVLINLTSYCNLSWDGIAQPSSDYTNNLQAHEVTSGIDRVYFTQAPFTVDTNGIAGSVAYDNLNSSVVSAYSVYGQGKIFAISGELDFTDDYLFFGDNLEYSRNIIEWLISPLADHDMSLTNFILPPLIKLEEEVYLNATLGNIGQNTEINVVVNLIINGFITDSITITSIAPGDSALISFLWTPQVEDNYTIRLEAQSVPLETNLLNNFLERTTFAKDFLGIVLFDQTHGADSIASYSDWIDALTQQGIGIETHDSGPITEDLLFGYGAFVTVQAGTEYTPTEVQAIENFVAAGGGLMVIGDDNVNVYTGLTQFAQMTWTSGGSSGKTTDIAAHPITIGVDSFYLGAPIAQIVLTGGDAQGIIRDVGGEIQVAVCTNPGRVISWGDEHTIYDTYLDDEDNERAGINAIKWLLGISTPHDLAISSLAAPGAMQPSDTVFINTTVWNFGTNDENDVFVNLTIEGQFNDTYFIPFFQNGTSKQVSFTFTAYEERMYNISVIISAHPNETILGNNIANKTIRARYIEGGILFEQGHSCLSISNFQDIVSLAEDLGFTVETNNEPVTASVLSGYAAYVIPNPKATFTSDELTAIHNFVANGGGLWVIGDENQEDVCSPLTAFAGINWTDIPRTGGICEEIVPHEVTQNIVTVDIDGSIADMIIHGPDALAVVNLTTNGYTMCAVSEPTGYTGRVAGFADEDSIDDGYIDNGDNLQLVENILLWLAQGGVINNIPVSYGVAPQSKEVMRNSSVSIYANGADLDEPEYMLTAYFEYKAPSSSIWETIYLTSPSYDNNTNRWWISFEPPNDAVLGLYDLRIQFMDSQGAMSNYSYANDSVEVKNNNPKAIDLFIEINSVLRTQSVYVYANASDMENTEDVLFAMFEHKNETGSWESDYFQGDPTYISTGSEGFWRITFTPPFNAMLGDYDFRVNFSDSDNGYSGWIEIENVLHVKNNPPVAKNIYSYSTEVLRAGTITIYAKGEDVEDPENMLVPNIKHKSPISGSISNQYLSIASWDTFENAWKVEFTPDLNAELGIYNFSVVFTDEDLGVSQFAYFQGILVKNSQPVANDIFAPLWVARGGSVKITANGSDMEDSEDDLIPHFSYKVPGSNDWENAFFSFSSYENGYWVNTFSPDISSETGPYTIRIIFEDEDGSFSDSVQGSCEVRNNPPGGGDIKVSSTKLFKTETIIIRSKGNDKEDAQSDLIATFQCKPSSESTWVSSYLGNQDYDSGSGYHTIEFTPIKQAPSGDYDFRVRFKDTDGDFSNWVYKNESVEVLTKPPEVTGISLSNDEILRGDSIYIYAEASDLEDPIGSLTPTFEYQNPDTGVWEDDYLDSKTPDGNRWRITFNPPASAPIGPYSFRVRFSDLDGDLSEWEESSDAVYVQNNPPEVTITTNQIQDSLEVVFTASVLDFEDSLSNLEFRWVFGDGGTSTKQSPTHTYDEEGTYDITLRITDSDGEEATDELTITIEVEGGDGDGGDGVDSDGDGGFNMMLLVGILLPIIVVILLVVLLLARKKKKEEAIPPTVTAQPQAAPSMPQVPSPPASAQYAPQQPQVSAPMVTPTPVQKVAAKKPGLKNIKCPRCKHTFGVEAKEGQVIMVQCPSCGAKGQMKF